MVDERVIKYIGERFGVEVRVPDTGRQLLCPVSETLLVCIGSIGISGVVHIDRDKLRVAQEYQMWRQVAVAMLEG